MTKGVVMSTYRKRRRTVVKKKKSFFRSKFFRGISIAFCILLILSAVFLFGFRAFLADYQACIPENVTDKVVSDFEAIASSDESGKAEAAGELIAECSDLPGSLQQADNFVSYYDGIYNVNTVCLVDETMPGDDNLTYAISGTGENGKVGIGTLVLTPSDKKSFFHNTKYTVNSISLNALRTYTITAPKGVTVYADGSALDEAASDESNLAGDNASENSSTNISGDESFDNSGEISSGNGISDNSSEISSDNSASDETSILNAHFACTGLFSSDMVTYVVNDLTYIGEVTADGCDVTNTETDTWKASFAVSDDEINGITSFAGTFMQNYSVFATKRDAPSDNVKAMIYSGADILTSISAYKNDWGQLYSSAEFKNENVSDICKYADNIYSCKASCTYTVVSNSSSKDYDFSFVLYLTNLNGEWKITDMESAQ